jgi:septal ring factor EnvC (AmiA/AmiB activator)
MSRKTNILLSCCSLISAVALGFLFGEFSGAQERTATESARSQAEQMEQYLLEQQGELRSVHSKERDILGELERLEKDVAEKREEIGSITGKIEKVSEEIRTGQGRISKLNQSSMAVRKTLEKRLVAFYKFGRSGYVRLLASSTSLQEFQKAVKYIKALMRQDQEMLHTLGRQMNQSEDELRRLNENRTSLEALKKAKDKGMALLEKSIEKKVLLLMKVHREKEFYAKAVEELKGATHALNYTVMHLGKEQREESLPHGFAQMKGRVPLPLDGKIVAARSISKSNPFMHRNGVYITGSQGEEVRSVFPGRVDFSGWFRGYGQLMIINHGSRYFTIFAHLDRRLKEKGEMVSSREAVAIAGNPGWAAGPGVYFEVRRGREHLDAQAWLRTE